ncbi:MAG TPA: hypothetical protein VFS67_26820 [Polyangiaceae bacterium]|nr:hypothetical protein [Polyangiaceae bacterium]
MSGSSAARLLLAAPPCSSPPERRDALELLAAVEAVALDSARLALEDFLPLRASP